MKELLIIIPVHNEEENILAVIEELKRDMHYADVLVINDCSKDNSLRILIDNDINHINTPFNLGYAGAIQTGFKYAIGKGYKYVAQFDGDGQHVAKELDKLYNIMKKGNVDIVIGSRFKAESGYHHTFFRKVGTCIFKKIIKVACKQEVTDPTSGLQVLNKKVYSQYAKINGYPDYPDANLLIDMLLQGYTIEEVAVRMRERIAGESMHAGAWKPFKYIDYFV